MPNNNSCPLKPVSVDFTLENGGAIYKGSCWEACLDITERDSSTKVDTPFDLTGFSGICQIRDYSGASDIVATPTVPIQGNRITITLDDSVTSTIPTSGKNYFDVSTYPYDLFLSKDGNNFKVLQGFIDVSPSITETV